MRQIEIRRRTFIHIYDACEAKEGKFGVRETVYVTQKSIREVSPLNCGGDQDIINNHAGLARRRDLDSVVNVFRTSSRCLFPRKRNYGNVNFLQRESNVPGKVGRINYSQALISLRMRSRALTQTRSFFDLFFSFLFYFARGSDLKKSLCKSCKKKKKKK